MIAKRVTHKDVAEYAGVSVATVSYVLNNGPRPVSPDTKARVEAAIAELGYYPNEMARGLRLQQSSTIGLILPNIINPVFAEIAHELEKACQEEGFLLLLCNSERQHNRELQLVHLLRAKQVDGVVLIPHCDPMALVALLKQARIPTIVLEHDLSGVHCIANNDIQGGEIAARHLIGLGHRRIALIRRTPTSALSSQRYVGYRRALDSAGIPFDPALVVECTGTSTQAAGAHAMHQLLTLQEPPSAVCTHNDILAMGALHAIHESGLRVPQDISVVGYDDIASAAYFFPPLTTIRSPRAQIGTLAGRMILQLAQHKDETPAKTIHLPVELIVRSSTAPRSAPQSEAER